MVGSILRSTSSRGRDSGISALLLAAVAILCGCSNREFSRIGHQIEAGAAVASIKALEFTVNAIIADDHRRADAPLVRAPVGGTFQPNPTHPRLTGDALEQPGEFPAIRSDDTVFSDGERIIKVRFEPALVARIPQAANLPDNASQRWFLVFYQLVKTAGPQSGTVTVAVEKSQKYALEGDIIPFAIRVDADVPLKVECAYYQQIGGVLEWTYFDISPWLYADDLGDLVRVFSVDNLKDAKRSGP